MKHPIKITSRGKIAVSYQPTQADLEEWKKIFGDVKYDAIIFRR